MFVVDRAPLMCDGTGRGGVGIVKKVLLASAPVQVVPGEGWDTTL